MASKGLAGENARRGGFRWQRTTTIQASIAWPRVLGAEAEAEGGAAIGGWVRTAQL